MKIPRTIFTLTISCLISLSPSARAGDAAPAAGRRKTFEHSMRAADAAFAKEDYDEALKYSQKMLDANPKSYPAALYMGDSYHMLKQYDKAVDWYERAIAIDPNMPEAYINCSITLTDYKGEYAGRTKMIQAIAAKPYNSNAWTNLSTWAEASAARLNTDSIPMPEAGKAAYEATRAAWKADRFKKRFPKEKEYRHSLAEEAEALTAAADAAKAAAPADDVNAKMLVKLKEEGMLEPYILLLNPDKGLAKDYDGYRNKNRRKLEKYLDTFVVPPAPPNNP